MQDLAAILELRASCYWVDWMSIVTAVWVIEGPVFPNWWVVDDCKFLNLALYTYIPGNAPGGHNWAGMSGQLLRRPPAASESAHLASLERKPFFCGLKMFLPNLIVNQHFSITYVYIVVLVIESFYKEGSLLFYLPYLINIFLDFCDLAGMSGFSISS